MYLLALETGDAPSSRLVVAYELPDVTDESGD